MGHYQHGQESNNGQRLSNLAWANNLVGMSSLFTHNNINVKLGCPTILKQEMKYTMRIYGTKEKYFTRRIKEERMPIPSTYWWWWWWWRTEEPLSTEYWRNTQTEVSPEIKPQLEKNSTQVEVGAEDSKIDSLRVYWKNLKTKGETAKGNRDITKNVN